MDLGDQGMDQEGRESGRRRRENGSHCDFRLLDEHMRFQIQDAVERSRKDTESGWFDALFDWLGSLDFGGFDGFDF